MLWFRRRLPRRPHKRLEVLAELHARASVREAEEIVAVAWADQLGDAVRVFPGNPEPLEYQRWRLIRAARKRARAAERDRRLLRELEEDSVGATEVSSSIRHRRADDSSGSG